MRVIIANNADGNYVDVTALVADTLGVDENDINDSNAAEAQQIGFDVARDQFATADVDCGVI